MPLESKNSAKGYKPYWIISPGFAAVSTANNLKHHLFSFKEEVIRREQQKTKAGRLSSMPLLPSVIAVFLT